MAELKLSEQQVLNGGAHSTGALLGGFIGMLDGVYMPPLDATDGDAHHDVSFVDMMETIARRLATTSAARVYKDSEDTALQFSVAPFSVVFRGLLCTFAGQINIDGLAASTTKYIYADLSLAPTVTIGVGDAWPATPHLRIDVITAPATGHWLEQHRVRHLREQAVQPVGGQISGLRSDLTFASGASIAVATVPADAMVGNCQVIVTTAFNGTAPTLKIGDATDDDRHATTAEIDLTAVGTHGAWRLHKYAAQTDVIAALDIDGSTAGEAVIVMEQR